MPSQCIAEVAVPRDVRRTFDYSMPERLRDELCAGMRVRVPFRNEKIVGTVIALKAKSGIFRGGLSLDSTVIVVEIGETAIAYPYPDIIESGVINDVIEGLEIAVVVDPSDSGRWMVFSRRLSDRIVLLEIDGPLLVDSLTGEEIDPVRGLILTGPDAGEALGTVPAFTSFPRDFSTFFPQGQIWQNG